MTDTAASGLWDAGKKSVGKVFADTQRILTMRRLSNGVVDERRPRPFQWPQARSQRTEVGGRAAALPFLISDF
jgi:hypothetical protein